MEDRESIPLSLKTLLELEGYEVLETIRRTPAWHDIHVLMTSGEDSRDQALHAGADGYILKPYLPEKYVNFVQWNLEENEK